MDTEASSSTLREMQNDPHPDTASQINSGAHGRAPARTRLRCMNAEVFSRLRRYLRRTPFCSRDTCVLRDSSLHHVYLDEHRARCDIIEALRSVDVETNVYHRDREAAAAAGIVDSLLPKGNLFTVDLLDKDCPPLHMIRGGYLGLGGNGIVFEASASRRGRHEVYAVKLLFLDSNFMHDTYRNIMNALAVTRHMEMRICTLLRTSTAEELYLQDGFAVPLHCGRIRGLPDLFYVGSWGAACSFVVLYKKLYCSLADLMSACSYLSNPCRLLLSRQMIEVVYNLHAKGLVHRDLKDSNFLLDGQGNVYLGDFGLSVLNNSKEAIVYTPKLTDPADARTLLKAWDGRRPVFAQVKQEADLWALGMTLYKLWTGVYPFGLSSKHFSKSKDITNYIQQLSEDTSTSSFLRRGQDVWGRPILPEVQRIIQGLLRFDRRERLRLSDIINTSPLFA